MLSTYECRHFYRHFTSATEDYLGYVRRDLDHGIAIIDWMWLLDFADKQWK